MSSRPKSAAWLAASETTATMRMAFEGDDDDDEVWRVGLGELCWEDRH